MTEALIRVTHFDYPANPERGWPAQRRVEYRCGACMVGFFVAPGSVIFGREGDALLRVTVLYQGADRIKFTVDGIEAVADLESVEALKP